MSLAITRASYLEGSNFVPCFLGSKHTLPARKSKAQRNKDSPNGWCILSREFKGTTNVGGNVEKGIYSWNMVAIRSRINTPTRVFLKGKLGNFETSWKGCNETTGISNKRIMEETFARLTRRLTTRPRIKLLPSVYFHDERRRIERFFRSDRSRNFLIWATRNRPRSSEKYELVPTNLNQPPWSIRIVRDNVKFSFPFWPWTIPLWFRIVQLIVGSRNLGRVPGNVFSSPC